jgi:cytidine deaminase
MCAERVALGYAVAQGARQFTRIVIATASTPPAAPCGACRQALAEFGLELEVEAVNDQEIRTWRLGELLPSAFGHGDVSR